MAKTQGASDTTRTVVTILLLLFILPIGVIVMWLWTNWSKTVKWVVTVISVVGSIFWFFSVIAFFSVALVAANPVGVMQKAHNTARRSDVNAILNAIDQYAVENNNQLPGNLTSVSCPTTTPCELTGVVGAGNVDICPALVTKYLGAFPVDPMTNRGAPVTVCDQTYDTGYKVSVNATDNTVTVAAPQTQNDEPVISVTR